MKVMEGHGCRSSMKLKYIILAFFLFHFISTGHAFGECTNPGNPFAIAPEGIQQYGSSINDLGETVWLQFEPISGYRQIHSTTRGQLTFDPVYRDSLSINNRGDVVWMQDGDVYGIISGQLMRITYDGMHYQPKINDFGEIVTTNFDMESGVNQIYSSIRGQLTFELLDHQEPAINNSGDVVWTQMDASGFYQIYKLPYGAPAPIAVTDDFYQHSMAAMSNSGEVIWAQGSGFSGRRIYSNMRGQLTGECPAGLDHSAPSINACGDITFTNRETEYLVYRLGTNAPCVYYTVTPAAGANGSISPSTPQTVDYNQTASFTITPNTGYHTAAVTGCNGTLNGATYTTGPISADCAVMATFEVTTYALTVTKAGTGSGTVTSSPSGTNCGETCSASFASGSSVTLAASPNPDSLLAGWNGGGCSGTGACTVTMDAAKSVTATFNQYITVTAPNGGEIWKRNSTYAIKWSYSGNPGSNIKIELLKGGVLNRTISSNKSRGSNGVGSYNWKVPSNQITGTNFTIRITSTSNSGYTDTSDANFSIQ